MPAQWRRRARQASISWAGQSLPALPNAAAAIGVGGGKARLSDLRERRLASIRRRPDILVCCTLTPDSRLPESSATHSLDLNSFVLLVHSHFIRSPKRRPTNAHASEEKLGSHASSRGPPLLPVGKRCLAKNERKRRERVPPARGGSAAPPEEATPYSSPLSEPNHAEGRSPMKAEQRLSANPRAAAATLPPPQAMLHKSRYGSQFRRCAHRPDDRRSRVRLCGKISPSAFFLVQHFTPTICSRMQRQKTEEETRERSEAKMGQMR